MDWMDQARKRARLDDGATSTFRTMMTEGGCSWVLEGPSVAVQDVNRLRRHLQSKLVLDGDLRASFISGLKSELEEDACLHRSLAPLEGNLSGDSLVRVLLTVAPISGAIAELLILRLAESADNMANQTTDRLILSQFRWLDSSTCQEHGISNLFMRVMDACGEDLQKDILSVLPELLSEAEYEDFVAKMRDLCEGNGSLLLPVLQASSMLCLAGPLQAQVTGMVLQRFDSAAAADLPVMVQYLIKHATQASAKQVAHMLRQRLRFVSTTDPRSAAATSSSRDKGMASAESPSLQTLRALKAGLQVSPVSCEAFLAEIHGVEEAAQHKSLDLLVLAMLHSLGNPWRKSAVNLVKRKFCQELMDGGTVAEAVSGFQAEMADLFASFLSLAGLLASATAEPVQRAGSRMYSELFLAYQDAYFRQEVLRALHSHLSSRLPAQVSSALAALLELSDNHAELLLGYLAFLTNILEYIEDFTSAQLMQVCELFSKLAIAGALDIQSSASRSQGVSGRDEFQILLRKFTCSPDLRKCCIGLTGIVCFAKCLSTAAASLDAPATFQAQCLDSARELLDYGFSACKAAAPQHCHVMYTCLCDSLAAVIASGHLHPVLLEHVRNLSLEEVQALLGDVDGEDVAPPLIQQDHHAGRAHQAVQYLNLNGAENGISYPVSQLVGASDAASRDRLAYGPAMLGLCQAVELKMSQSLDSLTAVLGCSLCLPQLEGQLGLLSCHEQEAMCLSLWHAVNWLRETVNGFSADTSNMQSKDVDFRQKLILRLQHLCQLEALLKAALHHAPASLALPTSAGTTLPFVDHCLERKKRAGSSNENSSHLGNSQDSAQAAEAEETQPARLPEDTDGRFEKVRQHLRPLAPAALLLMLVYEDAEPKSASFAPHSFLLHELLRAVQEQLTSATSCLPTARAPGDLYAVVRQPMDDIAGVLQTCAPCLGTQLQRALSAMQHTEDEADAPLAALLPGCDIQEPALLEHDAAQDALVRTPAAGRVVQLSLQCLERITAWDGLRTARCRPLLLSVLASLSAATAVQTQPPPSVSSDSAQQVLEQLHHAFKVVEGLLSGSSGCDFEQELAVVHILHNLKSIGDKLPASSAEETLDLRGRLSQAAGSMLQKDWSHDPLPSKRAIAKQDAQSGWKGRNAAMAALLKYYISFDEDPLKLLLNLVDLLLESCLPHAQFAALNAASVATWYKALFEALLSIWDDNAHHLCSSSISDAACSALAEMAGKCAQAFAALVQVTKHHRNKQVHMQAIRCGGRFVEIFLTTEGFWRNLHDADDDGALTFQAVTKDVQKATRVMQILCSEAKSRKDISLIAKVPQVKRRLEQLLFMLKAVVHTSIEGGRVTVANLKHKDLEGRVIASQTCPESEEEDEDEDDAGDAEAVIVDGSTSH